ncbi:MAG: methylglyoxal synthase [Desertifilum sp. SIO1I2]|nr:methylglyoxal synthase [Desertifilum sp. SIO1I2]
MSPTVVLIAHDRKKDELVALIQLHFALFSDCRLLTTQATGTRITETTGLSISSTLSGSLGGDLQVAAQIAGGQVNAAIFLLDPLYAQPHEPDIQALLRICNIYNVPLATNLATASMVVNSLETEATS